MKKITILVSSVRKVRAADNILELVKKDFANMKEVETQIIDLKDLDLPFFDSAKQPANEEFEIPYDSVRIWSDAVGGSDGVLMLTPEYNHSIIAAQKNAIDWLYKEWQGKPVGIISYNWGAEDAIDHLTLVLEKTGAKVIEPITKLKFTKDINLDGSAIDESAVEAKISETVSALVK